MFELDLYIWIVPSKRFAYASLWHPQGSVCFKIVTRQKSNKIENFNVLPTTPSPFLKMRVYYIILLPNPT